MLRKTARLTLLIGILMVLFKLTGLSQPDIGLADGPVTPPSRPTLTPMPRPTFTPTALPPEITPTGTPPIPPPATDEPDHTASPSPTPTLELLLPMAGAERATPIQWPLALLLAGPILFWAVYGSFKDQKA